MMGEPTAPPGAAAAECPLRLGDARTFACAEEALRRAGFDERGVCGALGVADPSGLSDALQRPLDEHALESSPLAPLVRAFLGLDPVAPEALAGTLRPAELDAFRALDLLRPAPGGTGHYYAPVLLYPVAGMLVASDRHRHLDGTPFEPPVDWVFPAFYAGTVRFLRILPRTAARAVLDLCSGTGIGALVESRSASHAVATDITARSAHFASFNARLNRCPNVEVVRGDLYQAVAGRTFDRIVAHPPYVPATSEAQLIYRDAGATGESVLERIVAGLPEFLEPGGTFYAVTHGWDAKEAPFEHRVRHWLGPAHHEFDVAFALHHERDAGDVARTLTVRDRLQGQSIASSVWGQVFDRAGVDRNVYGALVLHRPTAPGVRRGAPTTHRTSLSPLTDATSFTWLGRWLRWREAAQARGELGPQLLRLTARLAPRFQVNVGYVPGEEGLGVSDVMLGTDQPFGAATRVDPWLLPLLSLFDGARSNETVYERARESAVLPEGFGRGDFVRLLTLMFEQGYLETNGAPWEREDARPPEA